MSPLRPLDLYTIRIVSRARSKLSNNTNFDNVALNAKFITHAHEIIHVVHVGAPRALTHTGPIFSAF